MQITMVLHLGHHSITLISSDFRHATSAASHRRCLAELELGSLPVRKGSAACHRDRFRDPPQTVTTAFFSS